ncbi:unnamed protein product [Brassica oleracea var. botrytis]
MNGNLELYDAKMKQIKRRIEIWGMDPCCWMCVSLNKNSGWRWIAMGFGLLDVYHSQDKSMDGMEVKNRHKLGG